MNCELQIDSPLWYVIQTKPREEFRAVDNLKAQSIETFFPIVKEPRLDPVTKKRSYSVKPLFPRYLFARFNANKMLHKVNFTRGVHSLVSFGGGPVAVDEEILNLISERMSEDGYIDLRERLSAGDKVVVVDGPFKDFGGVFERNVKQQERVMIMLETVNYQGRVVLEREMVRKADASPS
ncbi:MAG TPA: transcription termination/antitermination NusG family protein [Pyrinomonadaceae bacterium]|nr:transcription termination/antitermination NusG family protein [Pyrinomonadaceae bacterium]